MKQKRKRQLRKRWWSAKHFDYIVDTPIDKVYTALRRYEDANTGCFTPTRVSVEPTKRGQEYQLRVNKSVGKNLNVTMKATVESADYDSTHIYGKAHIQPITLIIMGMLFCTHVLGVGFVDGILNKSSFMLLFGGFSVLMFVSFYVALTSGINKMIQELEEVIYKVEYRNQQQWDQKKNHPSYDSADDFQLKKRGQSHAF